MNLVIYLFFIWFALVHSKNEDLIAVVQIFRHGQRTPTSFYPTDPYSNADIYWNGLGVGQLTNEGKRQHYALGQFTRNRYSDWLPKTYNKQFIYVQTTDVDRTHMSAQCNLYGLFPAYGNQVWRPHVDWQPIPIHPADPRIMDTFPPCSAYMTRLKKVLNEKCQHIDKQFKDLYQYLSYYTGANITTFSQAANIFDTLLIEEQFGFPLPSWTQEVYPEPLETLTGLEFELLTHTTKLKRFFTGPFFHNLIKYFKAMLKNPTSLPKYLMYSAHDSNVVGILNTIGQFYPIKPVPFTVSIWFELRKNTFGEFVNVWYKENGNFTQLCINGCESDCPLKDMAGLLRDISVEVDTWTQECDCTT